MNYRKLADRILFAPSRIMDDKGDNPYRGRAWNLVNAPDFKTGVLVAIFGGAVLAATSGKKEALLGFPIVAAFGFATEMPLRKKPAKFYYDSEPDTKLAIPSFEVLDKLKKKRDGFTENMAYASAATAFSTPIMFLIAPKELVVPVVSYIYFSRLTQNFAESWRADQALRGDWNVLATRPPEEKREVAPKESVVPAAP